jgi:uncharacterized protein YigE (DUF2233 family)
MAARRGFSLSGLLLSCWLVMLRLMAILIVVLLLGVSGRAGSPEAPLKLTNSPGIAVTSAGAWKPVQKGIEHRKLTLEREVPANTLDLTLYRFDTGLIVPRVIYAAQHNLKTADIKTLAQKTGAIAAINANYYDPQGIPLAFLKTAAKTVNPRISAAAIYSGIFAVKDRQPFFARRDEFAPAHADEGIQSGPLLLFGGAAQPITGAPNRPSRRALIGLDKDRRLFIAVTDRLLGGLTWAELQELFSAPQWHLQAHDLLALDGGASAQLYIKSAKHEEIIPGTADIPVAIGFFVRSN